MKNIVFIYLFFVLVACNRTQEKTDAVVQTRTSGTVKLLVDESFSSVVDDQVAVFKSDYKDAEFTIVRGNENKIVPAFLNDSIRVIVLSRMLTEKED